MGLRISTNVSSINAQRNLADSQRAISKSFAQLASGSRITKAADDAAGLSISENFKSQIRSFKAASRNAEDAQSLLQVAEGGLNETSNIIVRMRELAIQAASDTVSDKERQYINYEVRQLSQEAERIAQSTRFGNNSLLNGSAQTFDFQVDNRNDPFKDRISFDASQLNSTISNLGIAGLDYSTKEGARNALDKLDPAQQQVNGYRATIGAVQNRLISTSTNLGISLESLSAANARIRDADIAESTAELTRNNVLLNASTMILQQANQTPALALKLLG